MRRIAVIGAGSWGTALAIIAARQGHTVQLWSRNQSVADAINREHRNSKYLSEAAIPSDVLATTDLLQAIEDVELIVLAAPSHAIRQLVSEMKPALHEGIIVVSAAKGIEIETGKRISEVVSEVSPANAFVCLSGPSFAQEVVAKHPTAVVAASVDQTARETIQTTFSSGAFRVYTNDDLVGTELGGSVKNVMAIAAGMVAGLGFGSNSVAALITRGLAEMSRLARHEGAKLETLMGLAGLGDLVLTCTGSLSRNRFVGEQLGKGRKIADIAGEMNEIAEGVKTTLAVERLANRVGVDMPITHEVHAVLYEGKPASEAANELMTRPLRAEHN